MPGLDLEDESARALWYEQERRRIIAEWRAAERRRIRAAITVGYVRCDLDAAQVTTLPPPANDAPVFYANAIEQAPGYGPFGYHGMYGTLFRRARWSRGN